ncbi:MAG: hydantoinase/oxoprolinase family protein [SAR324 cluster bacterium]|nr:hydantoinase/oxoprolinase family protein [SAR324 cluster bacterium]
MAKYELSVDVGGTFTDVILARTDSGALWIAKTPTTPRDPSQGFFAGAEKVLGSSGVDPGALHTIFHGSTIATNAILEGKGARCGMIVSDGFRFVLEIGRHDVPRKENLFSWIKPARPVPGRRIMEVPERILLDGSVALPLDEHRCREAARQLKAERVEAVAVVFLHAYANPAHEQRAAELLREEFPEALVSLSSDVLPVFREYERSMATALNAYIQPVVTRYIEKLESGLEERNISAPLLLMKSNGGVSGPAMARRQAIHLALSGPAAGVIGAGYIGTLAGYPDAISIDIGGTSADVCLIREGRPTLTHEGAIGPFPLHTPIVDIHTIGAGGGSIAAVTGQQSLTVGPGSAGAVPGPACYGLGGESPTVTDANLVLGRIPGHLLGGEIVLDLERAQRAIQDHVAAPLGLDLHRAAEGILQIVNNNMVGALRVVSVEKGYDPGRFALVAFGGAGPMHAGELAGPLGTPTVIIPPFPGILCALGMLTTDLQFDFVQTCVQRAPHYDLKKIASVYERLAQEAATHLEADGVPPERRRFERMADLRYAKQGFELTIELPPGELGAHSIEELTDAFHARHEQLYTFANRETPVEIVNLRIKAVGLVDKLELRRIAEARDGAAPEPALTRPVHFTEQGFVETPVYERGSLLAGQVFAGPAVVDQLDTTTLIFPGQRATVDAYGNLILSV